MSFTRFTRKPERWLGWVLASVLPQTARHAFAVRLCERDPQALLEAFGPHLNREPNLDNMPFDLLIKGDMQFEHLAGLFASTSLDHAVIAMPIRQAAYLFGLTRQMKARKAIEVGRYKGGSTLVMAAAMSGEGELWSIDIGKKETRLHQGVRSFDEQLAEKCQQYNLNANIIVGDSRIIELDTGDVDIVFIDGDHSYEGVKNDFERFGKRVRVGGAVLFDDAFAEGIFKTHTDTVGRVVNEATASGKFKLVKTVNRMAHLERVR